MNTEKKKMRDPDSEVTAVIPAETLAECAAAHRRELAAKGLVQP